MQECDVMATFWPTQQWRDHQHLPKGGQASRGHCLKNGFSQSATFKHIDGKSIGIKKCGQKKEHAQTNLRSLP